MHTRQAGIRRRIKKIIGALEIRLASNLFAVKIFSAFKSLESSS